MRDLSKLLNPDDQDVLNASSGINWIPKEGENVLLPYVEESEEEDTLSSRRKKTEEVITKYREIIDKCSALEAQIENRCKNVKITLSKQNNMRVVEAMGRVFGIDTSEITFEQYKQCIKALADINNQLPSVREQ